ncbi:hypothetical protein BSZ35_15185 [Salinibacter sp. 10B]|nr:hypothetical protein BSZ35_15185 [Salinibacter sp. 10B]
MFDELRDWEDADLYNALNASQLQTEEILPASEVDCASCAGAIGANVSRDGTDGRSVWHLATVVSSGSEPSKSTPILGIWYCVRRIRFRIRLTFDFA